MTVPCLIIFLVVSPEGQNFFNFYGIQVVNYSFMDCTFEVRTKKSLP
jgi:hypothetical protein